MPRLLMMDLSNLPNLMMDLPSDVRVAIIGLTPEDWVAVLAAAGMLGLPTEQFIAQAAVAEAHAVLLSPHHVAADTPPAVLDDDADASYDDEDF